MLFLLITGLISLFIIFMILLGRGFMWWEKLRIDKRMKINFFIFLTIALISFGINLVWGIIRLWRTEPGIFLISSIVSLIIAAVLGKVAIKKEITAETKKIWKYAPKFCIFFIYLAIFIFGVFVCSIKQ